MNPIGKIKSKIRSLVEGDLKNKLSLSDEKVNLVVESATEAFQNSVDQLGGWISVLPKLGSDSQGVISEFQSIYPNELANVLKDRMEEEVRQKIVDYMSQKVPEILSGIGGKSSGFLAKIRKLLGF